MKKHTRFQLKQPNKTESNWIHFAQLSKKQTVILAVTVLLVAVACAAVGAYGYVSSRPEKVLTDAIGNSVNTILTDQDIAASGEFRSEPKDPAVAKVTVRFNWQKVGQNSSGSADIAAVHRGKTYAFKLHGLAFKDQEYYFKTENLSQATTALGQNVRVMSPYVSSVGQTIAQLDAGWVKITKAELDSIDPSTAQCATAVENTSLSTTEQKQLKSTIKKYQPFSISQVTPLGVDADAEFRFKGAFNSVVFKDLHNQLASVEALTGVKMACAALSTKVGVVASKLTQFDLLKNENSILEIGVNKKSRRVTHIKVTTNEKNTTKQLSLSIKTAGDVKIAKPTDSISLNELSTKSTD